MADDQKPGIDERERAKPSEPRPEETVGPKGGASPAETRRTEKYEVEAVTQEQEGGNPVSVPEQ